MTFLLTAFTFLRNSWIGKALIIAGGVLMAVALVFSAGGRAGRKNAEAKETRRKAKAVTDMKEIRDEVEGLPDADRRNELRRFVRNKDKR